MYNFFRGICLFLLFLQCATAGHAFAQTATAPVAQLPEPVRIEFAKGETAFTLEDHLAVGQTSKRYVLKVTAGQVMRVLTSDWAHPEIFEHDGTLLKSQGGNSYGFWRGELPRTQDYFIELKRDYLLEDQHFFLFVLINPVGQRNGWYTLSELRPQRRDMLFPNQYDSGAHDSNEDIPATYYHLLSIPFHNGGKILRVYSEKPCSLDSESEDEFGLKFLGICDNHEVHLAYYDPARSVSTYLGVITPVSYSGNSGGIFMPFAITKDDHNIILDAWMGDAGAGGGAQDYGYGMISVEEGGEGMVTSDYARIATRQAFFYDNYGKVVYLDNSDKMPQYPQPGPRHNSGALFYRDLVTNEPRIIWEEENTTFDLLAIDVVAKKVILIATKYEFTETCPKSEDGYYCAKKTTTARTIPLP
jgi:hypothetical protein